MVGEVRVEIEFENTLDRGRARLGEISEAQVRSARVQTVADSGAAMLVLPQDLVEALGLEVLRKAVVRYADDRQEERPVAGIVTVRVGNRSMNGGMHHGPAEERATLGQIPLEAMDLLVDCAQQKLVPRPESPRLPLLNLR
jgi:hypothetical protein